MLNLQSDTQPDALEALTEFLYIAPVGLIQFRMDGAIQTANPLAAQLLIPLTPAGTLTNAFEALRPLVPDLARMVSEYAEPEGVILDHQRCEVGSGPRSSVLSVTVHRIHGPANVIMVDDVTALVEQERQIYADRQRLRAIFDNVRDYAIYTVDPQGVIDEWNPSLQRLGGWLEEDVFQRSFDMFFTEEDRVAGRMQQMLERARATGSAESEGWRLCRNNNRFWANSVLTALPDELGKVTGFVAVSRDMTERKRMEDDLRRLATTDPLTGALNRRAGNVLLADAVRSAQSGSLRPGVIMLDIDHFKAINDHHGHDAGDRVLCTLVAICKDVLKEQDALVRWGGEEFLIILAKTSADNALSLAEALRVAIEGASFYTREGKIRVTASLGVAVDSADTADLLHRADAALYAAKDNGRNNVILSSRDALEPGPEASPRAAE